MAFTLEVLRGATTYNISAGNAISIDDVDDLGGASVRNQEESGPFQDGATNLGFRLEPRTFMLRLNVVGASATALDGHRDTLNAMFKPVSGVPIILKLTRDDGEVRQLDCQREGPLAIPLRKENRPGHLHRAIVQLRAADPTWYNPTEDAQTFESSAATWYYASGAIGTAQLHTYVESIGTAGTVTTGTGIPYNGSWSVALYAYSLEGTIDGSFDTLWYSEGGGFGAAYLLREPNSALPAGGYQLDSQSMAIVNLFTSGLHTYYLISTNGTVQAYRNNSAVGVSGTVATAGSIGTVTTWGGENPGFFDPTWGTTIVYGAFYNVALNSTQRAALHNVMTNASIAYTKTWVYDGDIDAYPVIELEGPMVNPVITSNTTGDELDLTGASIGSAETWVIDTRYGRPTVLDAGGSSAIQYLSDASDVSTFRIVADPIATGGTNSLTVSAGSADSNTAVRVLYNARFLSF